MNKFFESNPGLKSRFNTFIEFPDYGLDELEEILLSFCRKNDYSLEDGVRMRIREYFGKVYRRKKRQFFKRSFGAEYI